MLGCAFILHDLGMALAAYPGGCDQVKQSARWRERLAAHCWAVSGRPPSEADLEDPPKAALDAALRECLRADHAERSGQLLTESWAHPRTNQPLFLLEDQDIRLTWGPLIGQLAASHGWDPQRLGEEFGEVVGAPPWCPDAWQVDALVLAAALRVADAAHIDQRRAPVLLWALRQPSGLAAAHWGFQEALQKPRAVGDRLVFTSPRAFEENESAAWWTCFDTLRMVDAELKGVDALLADKGRPRFATRAVAYCDHPQRLTAVVPTSGWIPVDTTIKVGDVPKVVARLGGGALYGNDLSVPLRELVQNARDAVAARAAIGSTTALQIEVRLLREADAYWVEVEDNGIGMSETVLTGALLDFGTSYWGSSQMSADLPELLGVAWEPIGRFGIGFFSTFMWSPRVQVISRRYDDAQSSTRVLEFDAPIGSRPLLRLAAPLERLRDGGTLVRVRLDKDPYSEGGWLHSYRPDRPLTLATVLEQLCPALDVDLSVVEPNSSLLRVIEANDWLTIPGDDLMRRVDSDVSDARVAELAGRVQPVVEADGTVVGRLALVVVDPERPDSWAGRGGVVVTRGIRAGTVNPFVGVLQGAVDRAARDSALPIVSETAWAKWLDDQLTLARPTLTKREEASVGGVFYASGFETADLPMAWTSEGWLHAESCERWISSRDQFRSVIGALDAAWIRDNIELCDDVLVIEGVTDTLLSGRWSQPYWPSWKPRTRARLYWHGWLLERIAGAWALSHEVVESDVFRTSVVEESTVGSIEEVQVPVRAFGYRRPSVTI